MKVLKTISEFHQFRNLPPPHHPLISVIDVSTVPLPESNEPETLMLGFYTIAVKRMQHVSQRYGQQPFDFTEGIMSFMSPNQVFTTSFGEQREKIQRSGWVIYFHPDFTWNTSLPNTFTSTISGIIHFTKPCFFREEKKRSSMASFKIFCRNTTLPSINSASRSLFPNLKDC